MPLVRVRIPLRSDSYFDNYETMKEKQAVAVFSALAQESRLKLFRLLVKSGEQELSAGEIARKLGVPPATLSFHLKELRTAGLIDDRRDGRSILYSLNVKALRSLLAFLLDDCCQGRPELCQPLIQLVSCYSEGECS